MSKTDYRYIDPVPDRQPQDAPIAPGDNLGIALWKLQGQLNSVGTQVFAQESDPQVSGVAINFKLDQSLGVYFPEIHIP